MKMLIPTIALVCFFLIAPVCFDGPRTKSIDYDLLYAAIVQVEGDIGKIGPAGEIGPAQITTVCRQDLARIGHPITESECRDPAASRQAMEAYCGHYRASSSRDAAALWNGGPKRRGSGDYARRVEAVYRRLQNQQRPKKRPKRTNVNTVSRVISTRLPVADYLQIEELASRVGDNASDLFRKIISQYIKSYPECLVSIPSDLMNQLIEHCPGKNSDVIAITACINELRRLQDAKHLKGLKDQRAKLDAELADLRLSTVRAKQNLRAMEGRSHA